MATNVRKDVFHVGSKLPKRVVQTDGIFQVGVGLGLLLGGASVAAWLNLGVGVVWIIAAVALISGAGTLYLAQRVNARLLRIGALANLVGIVVIVAVLALDWNGLFNEGRWLLALLADAFLILGVAEAYVGRYVAQ